MSYPRDTEFVNRLNSPCHFPARFRVSFCLAPMTARKAESAPRCALAEETTETRCRDSRSITSDVDGSYAGTTFVSSSATTNLYRPCVSTIVADRRSYAVASRRVIHPEWIDFDFIIETRWLTADGRERVSRCG